jgi:hypothetical protein
MQPLQTPESTLCDPESRFFPAAKEIRFISPRVNNLKPIIFAEFDRDHAAEQVEQDDLAFMGALALIEADVCACEPIGIGTSGVPVRVGLLVGSNIVPTSNAGRPSTGRPAIDGSTST